MSITIQIIQGQNSASSHVIEKRFSPVGQASHCEVKLLQPDIPDIACLLEYDSEQGTFLVQCLHANLVFLNDQLLEQHTKVRWSNQQELRIGMHCRLYIGNVPATVKDSSKKASRAASSTVKATHPAPRTNMEETVNRTSHGRTPSQPQRETVARRGNQEIEEMNQEAAKKQTSQVIYIVLIVLCVVGAVMMLMVDTSSTEQKKTTIRYGQLDEKLLQKGNDHKGIYHDIRMDLNKARKEGNTYRSRNIYLNLKNETERRLENSTSLDTELDKEIVEYINQRL